jgi:hypothetical protein
MLGSNFGLFGSFEKARRLLKKAAQNDFWEWIDHCQYS